MEKHYYFVQIEEIYLCQSDRFHDRIIYCSANELDTELASVKRCYGRGGAVIRQIVKLD